MTPTEQQIVTLLERRQEINRKLIPGFTENHRWMLEAVELLLRHQLESSRNCATPGYCDDQGSVQS